MADIISIAKIRKSDMINDALEALKTIKRFCNAQYQEDCDNGKCPLYKWCKIGDREEYPCNWSIHI